MIRTLALAASGLLAAPVLASITRPPDLSTISQDELFDNAAVHEIEILFDDDDWFQTLSDNYASGTYAPGTFSIDGEVIDSVGVRFKGHSSYGHPGIKKPFRIKFGEYRPEQTLSGLPSIMLNNGFKDPTLIREAISYELLREVGVGSRTGFANLSVNGDPVGFYTLVETLNGTWAENHFDLSEDGNLWEGEFRADFTWLGSEQSAYEERYVLETNEAENDYTDLIALIDRLNHAPIADLPDSIAARFDVDTWLRHHAVQITLVSLDSYEGSGHNYYVYRRDDQERIVHIPWDENMAFGSFTRRIAPPPGGFPYMSALWENAEERPLVERILDVDLYREIYLRHMRDLLATRWTQEEMDARIDRIADVVRLHVYADHNKQYPASWFEQGLVDDVGFGQDRYYGLKSFVTRRIEALAPEIDALLEEQDLFLNELMADNETTVSDEFGEYDDYLEIYNSTGSPVSLEGCGLTDRHTDPWRWVLPAAAAVPAQGRIVLWLDSSPEQGDLHAPFALDDVGEELSLFDPQGELIDFLAFDRQAADAAWGRLTDGSSWIGTIPATPDQPNSDAFPPVVERVTLDRQFPAPGREVVATAAVTETTAPLAEVELVYDDGSGPTNLPMVAAGEEWQAIIPGQPIGTEIAYYVRAEDREGREALLPAGAPGAAFHAYWFVGASALRINELMADNATTLADDQGEFDDWIELANLSAVDIDLHGYTLTDDLASPTRWIFPAGTTIEAGGYLLVWADDDEGDAGLHASFKLSKDGEQVGLFGPGGASVLDTLSFAAQSTDLSQTRGPDGLGDWSAPSPPSPESHNGEGGLVAVAAADLAEVVVPAEGGSFRLQASVFNRSAVSEAAEGWTAARSGGWSMEPLLGPQPFAVAPLDFATAELVQQVPGATPAGTALYELRLGEWGGAVESEDDFSVTKSE